MKEIIIYSRPTCPFCREAKNILQAKNVNYQDIDIEANPEKREEMVEKTQKTSVPQIFVDGNLIGGCDTLYALEDKGELDSLLGI